MRKNSLEGTPLGDYAKAQVEKNEPASAKATAGEEEKKAKEGIQTEQTEKGTKISGLYREDDHDPHAEIGYERKK